MRILIAEDDSFSRLLLESILKNSGHEVVVTTDGSQALEVFAGNDPPLMAIFDVLMPEINGLELCRRIRRMPLRAQPYIIFLTAKQAKADILAGIEAGANDYLTKPLNRDELGVRVRVGINTCTQIIERQTAEAELSRQKKQFESIIGSLSEAVWSIAPDGSGAVYISPAGNQIYGRPVEDIYKNPKLWFEVVHPEDKPIVRSFAKKIRDEGEAQVEYRLFRGDSELCWVYSRARMFYDQAKNPVRIDGISVDITERKRLEEQLRQAQKLEAVGQLAAGIAHEINTPLQYVGDNTRFLKDSLGDLTDLIGSYQSLLAACQANRVSPEIVEQTANAARVADVDFLLREIPAALDQSLEGLGRVTQIVQSIKDFAHPGSSRMCHADLNKAIESTITVARNEWRYVADLETNFDRELPFIKCVVGEINQVVLNLIVNAAHAIADKTRGATAGEKGKITISTVYKPGCACAPIHEESDKAAAGSIEIIISDTGSGIPPLIREKIFDPFFTTKTVGKGTGQGLAIAHSVVAKHRGTLSFTSETGRGTTFVIQLPLIN